MKVLHGFTTDVKNNSNTRGKVPHFRVRSFSVRTHCDDFSLIFVVCVIELSTCIIQNLLMQLQFSKSLRIVMSVIYSVCIEKYSDV